ncbi:hypothetical protein GCM10010443_43260 [Actinoplanes cyaneus]
MPRRIPQDGDDLMATGAGLFADGATGPAARAENDDAAHAGDGRRSTPGYRNETGAGLGCGPEGSVRPGAGDRLAA